MPHDISEYQSAFRYTPRPHFNLGVNKSDKIFTLALGSEVLVPTNM